MSRFAVVHEDPEYDDDWNWEEDEAAWEDSVAEKPQSKESEPVDF